MLHNKIYLFLDIFDSLFANDRPSDVKRSGFSAWNDAAFDDFETSFDPVKESEIRDYLSDGNFGAQNKNVARMIDELPPEIKALLITGALNRKDID